MTKPNQTAEELSVFQSFAKHYPMELSEVEPRRPQEPDIRCKGTGGVVLAFELIELIDQGYAKKLSAMFTLKSEFEQSFKALSRNQLQLLKPILKNAAIFIDYTETATLRQKRSTIPKVFAFLESLSPTASGEFQANGVTSLNSIVKKIRVLRGNFNGPSWNIVTAGLLDDQPIQRVLDKFNKPYTSDANRIELLAYFDSQPSPLPDFIPLIESIVKTNIRLSQFSAVWIYSARGDKVLSHITK